MNLAGLPPLRQVIAQHRLSARRGLGQHFLLDLNLTERIARAAEISRDHTVIEIGPGPGGLTRALLATEAREVIAVERDERCVAALADLVAVSAGRLRVLTADAMATDIAALGRTPRRIVANLPYNAATAMLVRWLETPAAVDQFTILLQQEVAARLTAAPGNKSYGRLSVLVQWLCEARRLFDIGPRAFTPPPKVTSTLVEIVPRTAPLAAAPREALQAVAAAAFGQRRKMLRSSLRSLSPAAEDILAAAGIDPRLRAEEVDIAGFCALARAYADNV